MFVLIKLPLDDRSRSFNGGDHGFKVGNAFFKSGRHCIHLANEYSVVVIDAVFEGAHRGHQVRDLAGLSCDRRCRHSRLLSNLLELFVPVLLTEASGWLEWWAGGGAGESSRPVSASAAAVIEHPHPASDVWMDAVYRSCSSATMAEGGAPAICRPCGAAVESTAVVHSRRSKCPRHL